MKRNLTTVIILFSFLAAHAEHDYYLSSALNSNNNYHYTANSHIQLVKGFSANPQNGHEVLLDIDGYDLEPIVGMTHGGTIYNNNYGVVGAIGASIDISKLGGAIYNIPIELPDGLGGIKPQLSVTYHSQGRNGLLGWGWNLSGISSITRTGGTLYHDGYISSVNYSEDRFCLDGQRLMKVSGGSYGANGTSYRTEQDILSKIVSFGQSGINGPSYFKVWTADGRTLYYGSSADSKALKGSQNHINVWLLKKVHDRYGNQMEYHYINEADSYRLDRITYSGNSNDDINPVFTVSFQYESRDDIEITYVGDCLHRMNHLLKKITVSNNGSPMCSYSFTYESPKPDKGYSYHQLKKVEFAAGQEHFNPTLIQRANNNYFNASNLKMAVATDTIDNAFTNAIKYSGDFNGDGFTDIVALKSNWFGYYPTAEVFFNKGVNGGVLQFEHVRSIPLRENISWVYVADFDGNGLDDILCSYRTRNSFPFPDLIETEVYLNESTMSGGHVFNLYRPPFCKVPHDMVESHIVGDFTGEGKSSFLIQAVSDNHFERFSLLYTFNEEDKHFQLLSSPENLNGYRYYPGDFNGDGITEILYKKDNGSTCIAKLNINGDNISYSDWYLGEPINWDDCFPGDFNGDGMVDFLFYTDGETFPWTIHLSNSKGISQTSYTLPESFPYHSLGNYMFSLDLTHHTSEYIKIGDYDGDGCADISLYYDTRFYIFHGPIREGGANAPFANVECHGIQQFGLYDNMNVCIGNFLGQESQCYLGSSTLSHLPPMTCRYEVRSLMDGMGRKTEFAYDYLMPNPSNPSDDDFFQLSAPSSSSVMHVFRTSIPLRGLKKITTYNVNNKPMETRCFYCGGLLHRQGKGFLGFNQTRQEDYCNNQLQKTTVRQYDVDGSFDNVFYRLAEECVYDKNAHLMARTTYSGMSYIHLRNNRVIFPAPNEIKEEYDVQHPDRLLKKEVNEVHVNTHSSSSLKYDDVPSIVCQAKGVTEHLDNNLVCNCEFQEITNTVYASDDLNSWLINRPLKITKTIHRDGEYVDIHHQEIYTYNNSKPFQISSILELPNDGSRLGDPLAKKTDYLYDLTGNIISQTISTPNDNLEPRNESFEYNKVYGRRLLTKHTNALNETCTYTYDPVFNYCNSTTDCHGLVTQHEQDPLNIVSTTIHPDGTKTCKSIQWGYNDFSSWEKKTGQPTKITRYAMNGETLGTESYDINGEKLFIDLVYDNLGRITKKTLPYRQGETKHSLIYEYDEHSQVNKIIHPDGSFETIEHNGNTVSTTYHALNGQTQTESKTFNVMGWVVNSTDAAGNRVVNDYYPDGNLKCSQIEGDNNTKMEMTYDNRGNRTSISDPNYGLITSEYNAFNELIKQTSPKMDETSYYYDGLGNLVRRIETNKKSNQSACTEWYYGQEQGNHGLLTKITSQSQVIDYEYDQFLRLHSTMENRSGESYHTTYVYDNASRISGITYPSNYTVNYVYTSEGYLRCVLDSELKLLWKTSETNPSLQPTKYITGNGYVTQLDYDNNTNRLTSIRTTHKDNVIQDYSYEYDGFSNMTRRSDLKHATSETFTYDVLNRLTSATDQHGTSRYLYDPLGRMTDKTCPDGTIFTNANYSGPKPHAIKSAHTSNGVFPQERMDLVFNAFDQVSSISEGTNHVSFEYGIDHQRTKLVENIDGKTRCKTYVGNCEFIEKQGYDPVVRTFLSGPAGVFAVAETIRGNTRLHYIHKDHLGSWTTISNSNGIIEQENHFDAWGNCDNGNRLLFDRGFTGHEHIVGMGLINMNGRLYDPVTSSMLSPDNNIQMPDFSQNLNRYSYCLNNPLSYVDPDGNTFIETALVFYLLYCSDYGYELQKFLSPVAFHLDFHLSAQQIGIGFDTSFGIPKSIPISARVHIGATYYVHYFDNSFFGMEWRMGVELYALGIFGISGTVFYAGEITQTTNALIIGNEDFGIIYENDYMFHLGDDILGIFAADNGDRYRSAAAKIRIGPYFQIGTNLFTGDPGASHNNRNVYYDHGRATYGTGRNGENPDKFRAGVLYIGWGPVRIGQNGEKIRNCFQNRFAHDFLCHGDSPYFKVLDRAGKAYFYFGTGTGNTLW